MINTTYFTNLVKYIRGIVAISKARIVVTRCRPYVGWNVTDNFFSFVVPNIWSVFDVKFVIPYDTFFVG